MILYIIQWQASHDNWSWYANKPASIWIMQIIKHLHSMTCRVSIRQVVRLCLEWRDFQGSNFLKSKEFVEVNTFRIFSWPSILCKVFSYSNCTFTTSWTGVLGVLYVLMWWKAGGGGGGGGGGGSTFLAIVISSLFYIVFHISSNGFLIALNPS
jgi:hypothetical protein